MRPPLAQDRLSLDHGRVTYRLRAPWADGTTHIVLQPTELIEKLAALVPRPHKNLLLYHGVLAANARLRPRVVAHGRPRKKKEPAAAPESTPAAKRPNPTWADLMRRGLDLDVLTCPRNT